MPLDALIFDLDGTLVDTNAAHVESWVRAFARLGYKIPADRVRPEIGKGGDNLVPSVLGGEADAKDGEALRAASQEEYLAIAGRRRLPLFDGVVELLDAARARGLRLALATSSGNDHLDATFASAGVDLRERMDAVIGKSDVEHSKPFPDPVAAAVGKLALSPAQCAMVGDTPYDATSARQAGVIGIGLLSSGLDFDERALRAAGARGVYRDARHLLAELDEALRVAAPGRAHLTSALLEGLMREALAAAREGAAAGEAPIGCVLADGDGRVVARAYNEMNRTQNKTAHAEIVAFARAAGKASLDQRDLLLVSTLEPCVMCTGAAMEGAVDTIVFALRAPADNGSHRVQPPESPESQMPRMVGDVLAAESRALFEAWYAEHEGEPQAAYVGQLLALTEGTPAAAPPPPGAPPRAQDRPAAAAERHQNDAEPAKSPPPLTGVLETALYVADLDRSESFYTSLLGDTHTLFGDGRMRALAVAGQQVLLLFEKGKSNQPNPSPGGTIPAHDGDGRLHVALAIPADALDAWERRLAAQRIVVEARVTPPQGGTSLYFRDPDGHLVELATPGLWEVY